MQLALLAPPPALTPHVAPACAVNEDGTLRRITNWAELSDGERAVALRRIADRNKARLELLRDLKEVQKQEQEREERLQRILKTSGRGWAGSTLGAVAGGGGGQGWSAVQHCAWWGAC